MLLIPYCVVLLFFSQNDPLFVVLFWNFIRLSTFWWILLFSGGRCCSGFWPTSHQLTSRQTAARFSRVQMGFADRAGSGLQAGSCRECTPPPQVQHPFTPTTVVEPTHYCGRGGWTPGQPHCRTAQLRSVVHFEPSRMRCTTMPRLGCFDLMKFLGHFVLPASVYSAPSMIRARPFLI